MSGRVTCPHCGSTKVVWQNGDLFDCHECGIMFYDRKQ